jgi:hypothetical protein
MGYNCRIMLKLLAVVAMVLVVAQASMPVAKKAPNNGANDAYTASQDAKIGSKPAQPTPLVSAQNADGESLKSKSGKTSDDNQQGTINITKSAPMPESWSLPKWAVWLGWSANFVLTAFLIWGVLVARDSLDIIKKQTVETTRAAEASEESNRQSAEFFRIEKRPWVGLIGKLSLLNKKSTKPGYFGFTLEYVVKNFGVAPAFNTVVPFGVVVEGGDVNNYALVKSKVDESRKSGENIVTMTGDLLLPGAEKTCTCEFPEIKRAQKFVITGCIVYRFADGTIHHTELSYWIDLAEGKKAKFSGLWFQAAD